MNKKIVLLLSIMFLIIPALGLTNNVETTNSIKVDGQYIEGTVKKRPYRSDYLRMKVDRVTYIIMKDCKVFKGIHTSSGSFQRSVITFSDIRNGDKVSMRVNGNRIFLITVGE